jgi:hypothetical protein
MNVFHLRNIGFSNATSIDAGIGDDDVIGLYKLKFATIFSPLGSNGYVIKLVQVDDRLVDNIFLIILFNYPDQIGHWTLLYSGFNTIYFFDPYGLPPDAQWPYLENPLNMPERDSECGELVIFRAMYIGLNDYEFMKLCMNIGGHQLFDLLSKLDRPDIYQIFFPGTANSTPEL